MRSRPGAWPLVVLGLTTTVGVVLAVCVVAAVALAGWADRVAGSGQMVRTSLSDSTARGELARDFHLHIPADWPLAYMTVTCKTGRRQLNTCSLEGSFTGPAGEFDRYPSLLRAQPPDTADLPPAQPVTCADLSAEDLLDLVADVDCDAQQHLVLGDLTVDGLRATQGHILIAGSTTATTVHISAGTE